MEIAFISFLGFGLLHYFRQVDAVAVDGTSRHEGGHLFHKFEIKMIKNQIKEAAYLLPPDQFVAPLHIHQQLVWLR